MVRALKELNNTYPRRIGFLLLVVGIKVLAKKILVVKEKQKISEFCYVMD